MLTLVVLVTVELIPLTVTRYVPDVEELAVTFSVENATYLPATGRVTCEGIMATVGRGPAPVTLTIEGFKLTLPVNRLFVLIVMLVILKDPG